DGRWVVIEGTPAGTEIWNAATGQRTAVLEPPVHGTTCSPDSGTLVGFDQNGSLHAFEVPGGRRLWSTERLAPAWPWPAFDTGPEIRFTPDSERVLVVWHEGRDLDKRDLGKGRLAVWHARSGKRLFEPIPFSSDIRRHALSPDGQRLFTFDGQNTARLLDAR